MNHIPINVKITGNFNPFSIKSLKNFKLSGTHIHIIGIFNDYFEFEENMAAIGIRGFAKKKNSKNPSLLWKWVGGSRSHSEFFFGNSSPNTSKTVLIFWSRISCVFCLYTLFKSYYDLSVLSMSVMGFQKKKFAWEVRDREREK